MVLLLVLLSIDDLMLEVIRQFAKLGGAVFIMGLVCIGMAYYIIYMIKKNDVQATKYEASLKEKDDKIELLNQEIMKMLRDQIDTQSLVKDYHQSMNMKISEINMALRNNDQMMMKQLIATMGHEMKQKLIDPIHNKNYDNANGNA